MLMPKNTTAKQINDWEATYYQTFLQFDYTTWCTKLEYLVVYGRALWVNRDYLTTTDLRSAYWQLSPITMQNFVAIG